MTHTHTRTLLIISLSRKTNEINSLSRENGGNKIYERMAVWGFRTQPAPNYTVFFLLLTKSLEFLSIDVFCIHLLNMRGLNSFV